jgi:hypothetical protein
MNNNFENDIQAVNQTFDDMMANFKTNYVNFNTNAMLSLPSLPPPSSSDSVAETTTSTINFTPAPVKSAAAPDPNDAAVLKYRYVANNLLEKVRSQISSNAKDISTINADITPVHKIYLQMTGAGNTLDQIKSAAAVSLDDYKELYRTTVFGTLMYVVGAGAILYLLYKPQIQSQI